MVNYELGKIYTIRSSETVGVYVGSTCQPLAVRFGGHKGAYKTNNCISSRHIFDYGIENAYIELLENYPCNSKEELHKREGEHIRMMENCVNTIKNVGIPYKNKLIKCKCGENVVISKMKRHEKTVYHNNIVNPGMYKEMLEKIEAMRIKEKEAEKIKVIEETKVVRENLITNYFLRK